MIRIFQCLRCGHEWASKQDHPRVCAGCKSPYWSVPRKQPKGAESKICPKCKVDQPLSGFRPSTKYKDGLRSWCNKCESQCATNHYNAHRQENIDYRRMHVIETGSYSHTRRRITGVNKRPYPNDKICEICYKPSKRLSYHHWDDANPSWGIWVCYACHTGCNFVERAGLVTRYTSLKTIVEQ